MQARRVAEGGYIDHTPVNDVPLGALIIIGGSACVAERPIPKNTLGALAVLGMFSVSKATAAITAGPVYWDDDGDPVGGTAGSGAATSTATNNTLIGRTFATAGAGTDRVMVLINA